MSGGNHYARGIECYICGSIVHIVAARAMCEECRAERIREREKIRTRRNQKIIPSAYSIIKDPDNMYGFFRDSGFSEIEHEKNLAGNCYTLGTILKWSDKLWEVIQGKTKQELRACI
jgi:hypothetical protein